MSEKKEYVICTPGYAHFCGGISQLHYLSHAINEKGYKSYVTGFHKNPLQDTHYVKDLSQEKLRDLQHNGIWIYPDIVPHNPVRATNVIKYWLGAYQETPPNQMPWAFCEAHQSKDCRSENILFLPPEIESYFEEPVIDNRKGIVVYSGKGNGMTNEPVPETGHWNSPAPGVEIIQVGNPPTREGLAQLLQRSEVLYCYDNMSIITVEARLCGTPVISCGYILLSKENFNKTEYSPLGMGAYEDKPDIQKLKEEIPDFRESYIKRRLQMDKDLDVFIEKTQAWNPEGIYVDDPNPTDPEAHKIYGHQNFELFRTR